MTLKKHIPNTITAMNLLCGVIAVIFTFSGRLDIAFYLMLLAAVFDFCDGLAARALGAYSPMGKELDSLSDMVSFGVLPALMLHTLMRQSGCPLSCPLVWVPLLIAVFSGLRLAKFNIDERQTCSFIGLATPACAIICGSLACLVTLRSEFFLSQWVLSSAWVIPALAVVLSLLLVSEIPMFSMKIAPGHKLLNAPRVIFLILALASLVAALLIPGAHWSLFPLLTFVGYILLNVILLLAGPRE